MKNQSDNFNTIKNKHIAFAIVKSVVCGISLALAVTGVLLLALKLSGVAFKTLYYVLIGVLTAVLGGGVFFLLLFKPTDKKVAKRTDDDYGLNERVQTALEFGDREGTIVELQREDAEQKISNLPKLKFGFKRIWQFVVIAAVAVAIGVTGIVVPAKVPTSEGFFDPDSTPRTVTNEELTGVRELIKNIEDCSMNEALKTSVGGVLMQLLNNLESVTTEGTMARAVNSAIDSTFGVILPTLSYLDIGAALTESGQGHLAQAVTGGGNVYLYYMLTIYDEVRGFDMAKYDACNAKVVKGVTSLRSELAAGLSAGLIQALGDTSAGIDEALSSVYVVNRDRLLPVLQSFSKDLSAIRSKYSNSSDDTAVQNEIGSLTEKFTVNLTTEVASQSYNAAINLFVSNRLKDIFGYYPLQLPLVDTDKPGDGTDRPGVSDRDPGSDSDPSGSGGTGETEYGSDDMVWVPGRGYVKYGDIIEEYYNLINQYLHSDTLTEEQKNMISAYYDILFGSSGKNR